MQGTWKGLGGVCARSGREARCRTDQPWDRKLERWAWGEESLVDQSGDTAAGRDVWKAVAVEAQEWEGEGFLSWPDGG